jgi:tartrate dehydratase alpha subunit/fumarate hydratase class I-like protein
MNDNVAEKTKRICFSYPEDVKKQLEKIAKKEKRTLSGLMKIILDEHLEILKKGDN